MADVLSQSAISDLIDHLRGELPAHDLGPALAALIYLRWADFYEAEQEAIAAFDDTEYHSVLPAWLHWRSWFDLKPRELQGIFADRLPQALEKLNNSRHDSLATNLYRVASTVKDLGRLSPWSIEMLIRWLAEQPFETPSDRREMLEALDTLLDKAPGRYYSEHGEYHTPAPIARLIVEIAAPKVGDRVYDPCFGSAGLLTAVCDHVLHKEKGRFGRAGTPTLAVFGVERNPSAYVIGLTRLALVGINDPHLELGNGLERLSCGNPQRDGFDVILANPPWGMRVDPAGLDHFPVRTTDATGLFIQHALSQLRPEGRALVVVPQGFLFRSGPEQRLRSMLLTDATVEAVVALPESALLPYTTMSASILVLRRNGPTERIRMVDAAPYFEQGKGRQPATIRTVLAEQLGQKLRAPQPSEYCWDVDAGSLAEVDWDLTPKRRDQSGLLGILNSLQSKLDLLPLRACCDITSGRAIRPLDLVDYQVGEEPIPYIRIKDVQRGQATRGSSWLSTDTAVSIDIKWKLRAGDVLLSKSGTIGKVGVVRNGAVGGLASNGFFVLRPDQDRVDPHFLVAYLDSFECRAWLRDKARGAVIRHLPKPVLDELPMVLPALQLQQRVAKEYRENRIDVLDFLAQLLTEGEGDPIAEWIEKALKWLPDSADSIGEPLALDLLDRLASEVRPIRNQLAHARRGENPLTSWTMQFNEAIAGLQGVHRIPRGPGLLSILRESARRLKDTTHSIRGGWGNEGKARSLTVLVAGWLLKACEHLLEDVRMAISTDVGSLRAGEMVEIMLQVHNQGPLPIRDFSVSTTPDWGGCGRDYIAENSTAPFNLTGVSPRVTGTFTLLATWSGSTLDGQRVGGSCEVPFEVIEVASSSNRIGTELGGSPYVCGLIVGPDRDDVFFGREELLGQIRRQIIQSGNVILLEGNRRAGKSSILKHLEGVNAIPGWISVMSSFQGADGSLKGRGLPTLEVFRLIAREIAASLIVFGDETPLPDGAKLLPGEPGIARACRAGISEGSAFSDFRDYLEVVLAKLAKHDLGLLMMLDEFDVLQEGIESGVTSPHVPDNIRFLVQTYPRLSAILTGSRRLRRLREEYWSALFGLGTRFGVTSLRDADARRLVTDPVKGQLAYSAEAVERAIYLTARQPYILQCLCSRVFDLAAQLKTRSVTLDLVEKAGDVLSEANEHFAVLFGYAESDLRKFILALCHRETDGPDPLNLAVLQEKLASYGIEVDEEALFADLVFLRELELIEVVGGSGGGRYVLSIPLMGKWIDGEPFDELLRKARTETEDCHA